MSQLYTLVPPILDIFKDHYSMSVLMVLIFHLSLWELNSLPVFGVMIHMLPLCVVKGIDLIMIHKFSVCCKTHTTQPSQTGCKLCINLRLVQVICSCQVIELEVILCFHFIRTCGKVLKIHLQPKVMSASFLREFIIDSYYKM